jgi:hypothetical protein
VLGIDRHDLGVDAARVGHEGIAGADKAFLVGKGNPPSRLQGGMSWGKACGSADGGEDDVGIALGGIQDGGLPCSAPDPGPGERLSQGLASALIGKGCEFRPEAPSYFCESQSIAAAHDRLDPKLVLMSQHHLRRRTADRTGCSKDREGTGH